MQEPLAVLVVSLPEDKFPDGDETCRAACMHLAGELSNFLEQQGHMIPSWARGGCPEDCWVYVESECRGTRYRFAIMYFPRQGDDCSMAIQYGLRVGWWKWLFRIKPRLEANDPIHDLLRAFGERYTGCEMLTQPEFDRLY